MKKDYLIKAYAYNGTVRIYSAITTNLLEEARISQDLYPTATSALGRVLTASAIMGAMYKGDTELTIRVEGDGPLGKIIATSNTIGEVRGYVDNPHVMMQYKDGSLKVGDAVGKNGYIHVTKDLKVRDTFTSSSSIQTGEIAEDFTYYFASSEQIPSSVGLGVSVNEDESVNISGGYILQVMPGCTEDTIGIIENIIKNMKPISKILTSGSDALDIIKELSNNNYEFLEKINLKFHCSCNRERFYNGLKSLGTKQLKELLKKKETIETVCHFCNSKYEFTTKDINEIITTIEEKPNN